jgi:glutamyl-tRNA(Gln) amidotransferase subunit D
MSKEFSGYRGKALEALRKAGVEIGDRIRVTTDKGVYDGILIPRSEYNDEKHIVVKLKSGYNVGILITTKTTIEKVGKGTKPTFAPPPQPKQNPQLPKVTILSTGGTIASRVDYRTGAVRPALTASDLYSVVPELSSVAQVDAQILFSALSENLLPRHWSEIAETVASKIAEGVDGVVIAHGTDTMGYTAAALSFALQNLPVPVVLVGSQRSADRPSSDAATNLIGAVTAAAKGPFAEVVISMHESSSDTSIAFHRGTKVRKCHTSSRDTFKSINISPIGRLQDQKITMLTESYRKRNPVAKILLKPEFCEKVALLKFHPSFDPAVIHHYVENGYKAVVFEGSGLGHLGNYCFEAVQKAIKHGVLVGMTSQCIWGRVNMNVYNGGRDLQALGVIPLEDMLPETALVKLMWVFGQTQNLEEAKKLLLTNIAGEFSQRTLPVENRS